MARRSWSPINYNDSISVIDTATRTVRYEHDLRPFFAGNEGKTAFAGGEFPVAVVVKGMARPMFQPTATVRSSSSTFHR